jgi:hypothetical protein
LIEEELYRLLILYLDVICTKSTKKSTNGVEVKINEHCYESIQNEDPIYMMGF